MQTEDEKRMDIIGQNGNEGEHYDAGAIGPRWHKVPETRETPALAPHPEDPHYTELTSVLRRAYLQASAGKGAERHAQDLPFTEQPMQKLIQLYGVGFAMGQAGKKMQEAMRMDTGAAVRELLGAIVYCAGAIIHLEKEQKNGG